MDLGTIGLIIVGLGSLLANGVAIGAWISGKRYNRGITPDPQVSPPTRPRQVKSARRKPVVISDHRAWQLEQEERK